MLEIRVNQVRTNCDSRRAYDEIYSQSETDIALRPSYYLWLIEQFKLRSNDRYLDISCGHGQLTYLAQKCGLQSVGIDLSLVGLQAGRKEMGLLDLVSGNGQTLPFANGTFTIISNIGSLEHYVDMKTAITEMARVLQPGGRAFVLVPNTFSLMHNIWIAFKEGRTNLDKQPIQRYAARQEWEHLLQENGLHVEKTTKYEIERPRTLDDWHSYARHPKRFVRLLLAPLVPLNLAFCFLFECRKL